MYCTGEVGLVAFESSVQLRQLVEQEVARCKADVVRDACRLRAETVVFEAHRDDRVIVRPDRTRLIVV